MSWRPGEVWLDTDLWLRAGDVAAVSVEPFRFPEFGPPPGLHSSRERRAAWKTRRKAKRARATALALSPALALSLTSLRSDQNPFSRLLAEDPPSLTYRFGAAPVAEAPPAARDGVDAARPSPGAAGREATARPAARAPAIDWNHATSVGLPHSGRLIDGTQLPVRGPDWVTWSPVTDSSPNVPNRLYGTEHTIRAIVSVTAAYRAANPDAPRVLVGDISRREGGPMTDEHVSHQNGLDVDIYFPRRDGTLRAPRAPQQIDRRLAQDLLDRFVAAGAEMIFVGHATGLRGPAGTVVPYAGHENHMHVRFRPRS
jgi:hypothetical protein